MSDKKLRIIQWYTGEIARHQIRTVAASPHMELVGAFVHHEAKVGLDAGEVAGIAPLGVRCTNDMDALLALDADCVLYNPPTERYGEIVPILASGKNVVSIIAGWNPKGRSVYPAIVAACEQGQSSLYGTGLNPGLSYELALLGSSICTQVDSIYIKTCEPQDTLSPVFLEMFGFGKTEAELAGSEGAYRIFARSLQEVTTLLCEELGLPHDGVGFTYEFEPALRDYSEKLRVAKGTMAGLLVKASTTRQGAPVATIELRFLLGKEYVRPEWLAGGPSQGWIEVDVRGTPGSRLTHEVHGASDLLGTWATGTKAINAVPFVCRAKPGLLSPTDLPLSRMLRGGS
ncbi:MAG: hypothetical protein H6726_17360 [Sandaracinaceae bacterium]|nr:hypothetical protein [Myxococcales bacterium]MCB9659416.1 hypothetical protein [Sandaracinaceae bacterium]